MIKRLFIGILIIFTLGLGFYWQHLRDLEQKMLEEENPFDLFVKNLGSKPLVGKLIVSVHPLNNPKPLMRITLNAEKEEKNRFKIERLLNLIKLSGIHLEANKLSAYENASLTIQVRHKNTIFSLPVSPDNYNNNIQLKNFFKLFQVYANDLQNKNPVDLAALHNND